MKKYFYVVFFVFSITACVGLSAIPERAATLDEELLLGSRWQKTQSSLKIGDAGYSRAYQHRTRALA